MRTKVPLMVMWITLAGCGTTPASTQDEPDHEPLAGVSVQDDIDWRTAERAVAIVRGDSSVQEAFGSHDLRITEVRLPEQATGAGEAGILPVVEGILGEPAPTYAWPGPGGQCERNLGNQPVESVAFIVDTDAGVVVGADPRWAGNVPPCDGW